MDIIIEGFKEALRLITSFDQEVFEVVLLSLKVSLSSLFLASVVALPLGIWLAKHQFRMKHLLMRLIYTWMGIPPVLCGLFVYILFMRKGPLGYLDLNYTVTIMIIAQTLLIFPIVLGQTTNAIQLRQAKISSLAKTLGASSIQSFWLLVYECRMEIGMAIIQGFSRAISEVGAVMIVGGNIEGKTRTMTTYISQLKGMGNFERAVAVGIILLLLSFVVNSMLYHFQKGKS